MDILKTILMIIFAIDCIALSAIVLMQEGKTQGLGSIGGMSTDTYWGQNKRYEDTCDSFYCAGSSVEFKSICVDCR